MDTFAWIVTAAVLVFFVTEMISLVPRIEDGQTVTHHIFIVVLLFILLAYSYAVIPYGYAIEDGKLRILRPFMTKEIPLSSISKVTLVKRMPSLRVFGIGGLFGYYGYYWFPNRAFGFVLARNGKNLILIDSTVSRPILISPDDDRFLASLGNVTI